MRDIDKTREQLISDLVELRRRVSELETGQRQRRLAEEALRESEGKYAALVENSTDGIVIVQDGVLKFVNAVSSQLMGYTPGELVGIDFLKMVAPGDREMVGKRYADRMAGKEVPRIYEIGLARKDGLTLPVELNATLISYEGRPADLIFIRDITERKHAEERLLESRRRIERLDEAARRLESCQSEDEACKLTVEAAGEMFPFSMCTLSVVEGNKLVVKAMSSHLAPETKRESELGSAALAAKTYRTGKTCVFGGPDEKPDAWQTYPGLSSGIGVPVGDIGVFQVASTEPSAFTQEDARLLGLLAGHTAQAVKRIRLQNELEEQAVHDPLTRVYNRYYLNQTLQQEITRGKRYRHSIAFLMIDINRFKEINDRFGHQMGDKVLQAVASLLLESVRATDIVVRYGGDEFLIVLPETDGRADVLKQRIVGRVARRNEINRLLGFPVTLSVDIASWSPGSSESVEEVLSRADTRMYEDKRRQSRDNPRR
jgi:diguanylate cyclase (GGDEF)-like protein/PAS domain S-box-containing protein